jgi:hypothetical protein
MAGKKITQVSHAKINAFGEDEVMGAIANGETLTRLAERIGVSRPLLSAWCNKPQRVDKYAHAKRAAASALVDESLQIVDAAEIDTVQVAELRADTRKWIASRLDRQTWGDDKGPTVAIQINDLHLGALRQGGRVIEGDGKG